MAAAACGEGKKDAEPPVELKKMWQSKAMGGLPPRGGGLDDQPAGLIGRMTVLYNYWFAHKSFRQRDVMHHKEWAEAHPDLMALVHEVKKMREP